MRSSSKRWTENRDTAFPSRILSFMYSTSSPPPPTVITGPNSRESRTPTRISEPKPTSSKATFSQTRTPRRESSTAFRPGVPSLPARAILFDHSRNRPGTTASISSQAALTAPASAFAKRTPPASDLWRMSGETIFRTTASVPRASRSAFRTRRPFGTKTCLGVGSPAVSRRA